MKYVEISEKTIQMESGIKKEKKTGCLKYKYRFCKNSLMNFSGIFVKIKKTDKEKIQKDSWTAGRNH